MLFFKIIQNAVSQWVCLIWCIQLTVWISFITILVNITQEQKAVQFHVSISNAKPSGFFDCDYKDGIVYPGNDVWLRAVLVKTAEGTYERPVHYQELIESTKQAWWAPDTTNVALMLYSSILFKPIRHWPGGLSGSKLIVAFHCYHRYCGFQSATCWQPANNQP